MPLLMEAVPACKKHSVELSILVEGAYAELPKAGCPAPIPP